jgi:uncharacterized glyoxalase superfamily protein PhnB
LKKPCIALAHPNHPAQYRFMRLEHFALQVPDPVAMANWYVNHLGCTIVRSFGEPAHARFLRLGGVLMEIYNNPKAAIPDYSSFNPLQLHLAFESNDLTADRDRLVKAGARIMDDVSTSPSGDQIMMLRDPWNIPLQFVKRAQPML